MNKEKLAQSIASQKGITKTEALDYIDLVLGGVQDSLIKGEKVSLVNFGNFEVKERKERVGRNPQTGESMTIKAQRTVSFRPGKALRESVKK